MTLRIPFLSRRRRVVSPREPWPLSSPLLRWSEQDAWTISDAVTGTLITGATGSGKTTGSGQAMARALLRQGFGGLVLTTKPDERALWKQYCHETGRDADLRVFDASGTLRFNFLDYEATRR